MLHSKRSASDDFVVPDDKAAHVLFTDVHRAELNTQGYTVVPGVVTQERATELFADLQDAMLRLQPSLDMNDPSTFKKKYPYNIHALFQHFGAGQIRPAWEARSAMAAVYADLYGVAEHDLLTSMDAFSFLPRGKACAAGSWDALKKKNASALWAHFDGGPNRKSSEWTVQGQLVLVDSLQEDGPGLVVWPMSHLDHAAFCVAEKKNLGVRARSDWIKLSMEQYENGLAGTYGHAWVPTRVLAPAGSVILWNSCLLHQNVRPRGVAMIPRGVFFACMQPRSLASDAQLLAKQKAFAAHKTTTHNPIETTCFPDLPAARWGPVDLPDGAYPIIARKEDLTPLQQRLAGF